jgi:hypothetical protein
MIEGFEMTDHLLGCHSELTRGIFLGGVLKMTLPKITTPATLYLPIVFFLQVN